MIEKKPFNPTEQKSKITIAKKLIEDKELTNSLKYFLIGLLFYVDKDFTGNFACVTDRELSEFMDMKLASVKMKMLELRELGVIKYDSCKPVNRRITFSIKWSKKLF